MAVAGGHPRAHRRALAFFLGAATSGLMVYGALAWTGQEFGLRYLPLGYPFLIASGLFLAGWYSWLARARPPASTGRQISKRLAQARRVGPLAYGAVLGTGILTIVSTPAVWLGLGCCVVIGIPTWGAVYGLCFGSGRALMLAYDTRQSKGRAPTAIGFRIVGRQIDPRSRFWWVGTAGGLTVVGAAALPMLSTLHIG